MGYQVHIQDELGTSSVSLGLSLSREETNALFLSGDSMVSWPVEGLLDDGDPLLTRSSMFVSEVAARPTGITLRYGTREQSERAARVLHVQLDRIGIGREHE